MTEPTCHGCGEHPPDGARFCPSCGASLAATPAGERRIVTVVFADLAGFTTLAEGRDPEAVKELLDTCFGALVPVIDAHGGVVDKIIGDELMAVFGAPRAHEDDPERAVRAALALLDALERLDPSLEMRVGINTGEVLAGPVGPGGAYTVTGDTVNTAHRLVGVAQRGTVLVGERTHLVTQDVIRYGPAATHELRGRREAVVAHPALAPAHRLGERASEPNRVPLVGRASELDTLVALVAEAVSERARLLVTLVGEAGVGKTRLVAELGGALRRAGIHARVLTAHCAAYGGEGPLAPLASIVCSSLDLEGIPLASLDDAVVVERLRALPALDGSDHRYLARRVLQLLGHSDDGPAAEPTPARSRLAGELVRTARTVIDAAAGGWPLVVAFDDAQFAGPDLLDHIERYGSSGSAKPGAAVLIAVGREELGELRPSLLDPQAPNHRLVRLGPLATDACTELVHRTLATLDDHDGTLGPGAADAIVRATGGNPLLLDQLVRYLRETGALEVVEGGWRVVTDLADVGLPDGARAVLGARLDALPDAERSVLQAAAVVGPSFTVPVLRAMGIEAAPTLLERLNRLGLVGSPHPSGSYAFRHAMVRDAAYASVPLGERAARHALVARWLLTDERGGGADDPGAVAHHVERAVALGLELGASAVPDLPPEARRSLLGAARAAHRRDELREAERWYRRAIDLDLVDDEEVVPARLDHASTLLTLRRLTEAQAGFDLALAGARTPAERGEAATGLGAVSRLLGDTDASLAHFEAARAAWHESGDAMGEAASVRTHGWAELVAGRPRSALPKLLRARELEESTSAAQGVTLQCLAWCEFQLGNHAATRRHLWAAGQALSADEDRLELGWCFAILGNSLWQEGRVGQAEAVAGNLLATSQQLGDLWGEGTCQVLLSGCLLEGGDLVGAREQALAALRTFTELDDPWGDATARLVLGMVERVAGDLVAARAALERGLETALQVASVGSEARLRAELAATLLDDGDPDAAAAMAIDTLTLVRSGGGDRDSEIRALVVLAKRARELGSPPDARRHLDEAIALADGEVCTSIWRRAVAWSAIVAAEDGDVARSKELAAAALQGSWESARTWVLAQRAMAAAQAADGNRAGAAATLDAVLGRFRDRPLAFVDAVRAEVRSLEGPADGRTG
jgi:class 3 adenylate cyclase/tetratricopeptide (TPR) repeat protein